MTPRALTAPFGDTDIRSLKLGDLVTIDGEIVITAGLPTHQRLTECLQDGVRPPIDLHEQAFFHLGGYSQGDGDAFEMLYLNPTTSTRFNPYMPRLIEGYGLRMVGGKGGLDAACVTAMQRQGCVYLSFLGGGCTLLSRAIREVVKVGWPEMLAHYRLAQLRVETLGPAVVAIDAHGNSLYEQVSAGAAQRVAAVTHHLRQPPAEA